MTDAEMRLKLDRLREPYNPLAARQGSGWPGGLALTVLVWGVIILTAKTLLWLVL